MLFWIQVVRCPVIIYICSLPFELLYTHMYIYAYCHVIFGPMYVYTCQGAYFLSSYMTVCIYYACSLLCFGPPYACCLMLWTAIQLVASYMLLSVLYVYAYTHLHAFGYFHMTLVLHIYTIQLYGYHSGVCLMSKPRLFWTRGFLASSY